MMIPFKDLTDGELFVVYIESPTDHFLYMKCGGMAVRYSRRDKTVEDALLLRPAIVESRYVAPNQVVLKITTNSN
jgi:hypothetical protein